MCIRDRKMVESLKAMPELSIKSEKSGERERGSGTERQPLDKKTQMKLLGNCRSVSDFEKLHTLGEGTFGTVYCARDKTSNEIVALKKVKIHDVNEGFPITSLREIKILSELRSHVNIVKLKEVVVGYKQDSIFLVFEYCNLDLANLIDRMAVEGYIFSEPEIKCLVLQLINGVRYLHHNYIMHRDLKLSNLLINAKGIVKLADFGLSRRYEHPPAHYTRRVVTLWYRSPELLIEKESYNCAVDMWSIGCILGELLKDGIPILRGKDELNQFQLICELIGFPSKKAWPDFYNNPLFEKLEKFANNEYNNLNAVFKTASEKCIDLLNALLTWDPAKRITADEALVHPYFFEHPRPCDPEEIRILSKLEYFEKKRYDEGSKKQKTK
eukprot:TRINITY_DN10177_c0_g2_i1.p1 TRINITY_DN10177_c0_g2~~TRINITY_DN10177_c0_g2_i1.p1  ORF type:complete len:404 (+),score=103.10 TRINITY_DN10177_c0_g2_i1:61-1212(+)